MIPTFEDFKTWTKLRQIRALEKLDVKYTQGKPAVTDRVYDKMRDYAQKKYPNDTYFLKVGATTRAAKKKLPITVGSLDKIRPGSAVDFYNFIEKKTGKQQAWYVTPKLDGQSGLLFYKDRKLVSAMTRGDGTVGRDITEAARHVQGVLPTIVNNDLYEPFVGQILVRGEFIMHSSIFEEHYTGADVENVYKNPRNFVVGLTNRIDVANSVTDLKRCTFVAYHLYTYMGKDNWQRPPSRHRELLYLSLMGLTTITNPTRYTAGHYKIAKAIKSGHKSLKKVLPVHDVNAGIAKHVVFTKRPTEQELIDTLRKFYKIVDIPIDGLVIDPLDTTYWSGKSTESRPVFSKAIKLDPQDQESLVGTIKSVTWEVSKRGLIKPVVVLAKPLNLGGADVTNVTANNARFVASWGLTKGTRVKVIRSGDVIPRLVAVSTNGKWRPVDIRNQTHVGKPPITRCPSCNSKLSWSKNKVDLVCSNADCEDKSDRSVASFFSHLNADYVASGTLKALTDAGFTSIPKILAAKASKLAGIPSIGAAKAAQIEKTMKECLQDKPLAIVAHASNIFSTSSFSLGSTRLAAIFDKIEEKKLKVQTSPIAKIDQAIASLHGLGPESHRLFIAKLPEWRKFYTSIEKFHTTSNVVKSLKGTTVAFTGFRDPSLEQFVVAHGGRVGGVSKNCTVLFAASMGSTKCNKANQYGIPIVPQVKAEAWLRSHA